MIIGKHSAINYQLSAIRDVSAIARDRSFYKDLGLTHTLRILGVLGDASRLRRETLLQRWLVLAVR
ncbi:hypothetical protein [Scytonema sp. HK-05]|uniref:hypothetical protein n=1 Tax=Scytonema sp. HK-05 TaxID=1137095 RepID=UPI000B160EA0|nr:hypothetical protein [Scytonema sp. HK-05]